MAHQSVRTPFTLLKSLTVTTVAASVASVVLVIGEVALAAPRDPIPPRPSNWGYVYGAQQPGQTGPGSGGVSGTGAGGGPAGNGGGQASGPGPIHFCPIWRLGMLPCDPPSLPGTPQPDPSTAPQISPAQLAQQAWRRLPIPAPEVATAPPRGSDGLVGLPQWFWVTNWDSHSDRVQVGGAWAAVTARPTGLTVDPGAGQRPLTCAGPGTAYDRQRSARSQRSGCSYTYNRSSAGLPNEAYTVTVTVTWGGTWVGSGGAGGTLPALSRSTTFPLRVAEGQAVTSGG
jgi:hypothetical protein